MDTSFTMCTHAVDALSLGSLLYQMLYKEPCTYAGTGCARYEVDFKNSFSKQACVLLHFFIQKSILHCFREQLFFSGFSAFQWCSPEHITHESGSWSWHCWRVLCRRWALAPTLFSVMFWRHPSPLSCTRDETRSRLMGKEGYLQRMHLISIKMTLFPN